MTRTAALLALLVLSYSRLAAWLRGWNQQLDPAVQVTHMPLTAYHCQLLLVLQAVL